MLLQYNFFSKLMHDKIQILIKTKQKIIIQIN